MDDYTDRNAEWQQRAIAAYHRWGVHCATISEFACWYGDAMRFRKVLGEMPTFSRYCEDGDKRWCEQKRAVGMCCSDKVLSPPVAAGGAECLPNERTA